MTIMIIITAYMLQLHSVPQSLKRSSVVYFQPPFIHNTPGSFDVAAAPTRLCSTQKLAVTNIECRRVESLVREVRDPMIL